MNHGDVLYPLGAGLLAGMFVFAISAITGRERNFGIDLDLAVLIGTATAFSVLAARRPDLAMWAIPGY